MRTSSVSCISALNVHESPANAVLLEEGGGSQMTAFHAPAGEALTARLRPRQMAARPRHSRVQAGARGEQPGTRHRRLAPGSSVRLTSQGFETQETRGPLHGARTPHTHAGSASRTASAGAVTDRSPGTVRVTAGPPPPPRPAQSALQGPRDEVARGMRGQSGRRKPRSRGAPAV